MKINKIKNKLRSFYKTKKNLFLNLFFKIFYTLYSFFIKITRTASKHKIIIKRIGGINYELHLNQAIDSIIYYAGCFEIDTSNAIARFLKPGMVALDIGANIGSHTLPMAKIVGTKGKIIAFEPMKWALKKLKRNITLNNFNNIIIENIALSDKTEFKEVWFRSSWTVDNTIINDANIPHEVQMETLDKYINTHHLKKVDFIKIDVDGYEFKVLRGAIETLKKFKPTMVVEIGDYTLKEVGDNLEDLIEFLFSLGYKIYDVNHYKIYKNVESIIQSIGDLSTKTINVVVHHPRK
ncbi:MAG: FkbM family methyltransferase [Promethearchaeota archaeon]